MLRQNKITSSDWLNLIGKDRLQAYQDSYAQMHGISLVFLNTDGEPLTVRSNASLFCCAVAEKSSQRCREESHRDLARARMRGDLEINPCFLGLMNFILPIYYDNELVAYCTGGGVADEKSPLAPEVIQNFHVPHIKAEEFKKIARNFQLSLRLLNLDVARIMQHSFGESGEKNEDIFEGKLSRREAEVARAICSGMTNKQVADALFISEKTVKSHVSNILVKLNLRDRIQLVVDYCRFTGGIGEANEHKEKN